MNASNVFFSRSQYSKFAVNAFRNLEISLIFPSISLSMVLSSVLNFLHNSKYSCLDFLACPLVCYALSLLTQASSCLHAMPPERAFEHVEFGTQQVHLGADIIAERLACDQ